MSEAVSGDDGDAGVCICAHVCVELAQAVVLLKMVNCVCVCVAR